MKNVVAFFDIDGTIYRNSLLIDHFKKLIKYEILPKEAFAKEVEEAFSQWYNRKGDYETYLLEISKLYQNSLKGMNEKEVEFVADRLLELKSDKVYTYTRDRIKWHLDKGHLVIFISGSPDFLVSRMAKKYGITDSKGSIYTVENGKYTGDVIAMWDHVSKSKEIDRFVKKYNIDLTKSYAYGDTNGDLFMLEKVGNPIAINPSRELIEKINKNKNIDEKLKIVVERKDVVYVLDRNIAYIR